ncbi:hypothetical protein PSET11_02768 [Arthrobacter ulcerisalmonis]|uniref:Uncharacterized protein n=1 Tax=Arthrobacter ulcerisalmonis TaxID=2483813 RepID=A0A3P5X975_9MICC|nr:hypothetical protein PSET11_02768 [Arthrobacter ulcerisalmonis]
MWVALVALSLLFYLLLGIRLFRNFMATTKELGAAAEKFGSIQPLDMPAETPNPTRAAPGSAVFASPEAMRHDYGAAKAERREVRRQRRVQRRTDRGQPQALGDLDFT